METDNNWVLERADVPAAGGSGDRHGHSQGRGATHQAVALRRRSSWPRSACSCSIDFDYDNGRRRCSTSSTRRGSTSSTAGTSSAVDGMSLPLVSAHAAVVPLCMIFYTFGHFPEPHNPKAFLALILILQTGHDRHLRRPGSDLVLRVLRGRAPADVLHDRVWGGEDRRYASLKFFLYTMFGSALMLVSFLAMYFLADGTVVGDEANTFAMRRCPTVPPAHLADAASSGSSAACSSASG